MINQNALTKQDVLREVLNILYINDEKMITNEWVSMIIRAAYENFKDKLKSDVNSAVPEWYKNNTKLCEHYNYTTFHLLANDKEKLSKFNDDHIIKTITNSIESHPDFIILSLALKDIKSSIQFKGITIIRDNDKITSCDIQFYFLSSIKIRD
jgi:hypothetical protein